MCEAQFACIGAGARCLHEARVAWCDILHKAHDLDSSGEVVVAEGAVVVVDAEGAVVVAVGAVVVGAVGIAVDTVVLEVRQNNWPFEGESDVGP
jgi:hypothetical protein